MSNFRTILNVEGKKIETLSDILPNKPGLKILFIAKTPLPKSVESGHYFQGTQGTMLWNKLARYDILKVPDGEYHDEYLLKFGFGITDIVKVPRAYGSEPSADEYQEGMHRILELIKLHEPKILFFVYKGVLDKIMKYKFKCSQKSEYGFNDNLYPFFSSNVFVFPMPGTPCKKEFAHQAMSNLRIMLAK